MAAVLSATSNTPTFGSPAFPSVKKSTSAFPAPFVLFPFSPYRLCPSPAVLLYNCQSHFRTPEESPFEAVTRGTCSKDVKAGTTSLPSQRRSCIGLTGCLLPTEPDDCAAERCSAGGTARQRSVVLTVFGLWYVLQYPAGLLSSKTLVPLQRTESSNGDTTECDLGANVD